MELFDARVLVSGGTSGIGAALVQSLTAAGARVVTCGRDADRCTALAARHPDVTVLRSDLSEVGAPRRVVKDAAAALGGLDVVVNNAAVQVHDSYVAPSPGIDLRIAQELAVNLRAPLEITAAALPLLSRSDRGALVFVTSGLAVFPKKTAPVYCATKAALRTFATAVRYQVADEAPGVRVIDVVLPLVDTPMTAGRSDDAGKQSPDDVAARIVRVLSGSRQTVRIGKARILPVFERLAPSVGRRILRNG